jgi:hypothetical protein
VSATEVRQRISKLSAAPEITLGEQSVAVSQNIDFGVALSNLKQTYAKDLEDNRPNFTVLQELLPPNRDGIEVGDKLNIPVLLSHQGGESYGTSGDTSNLGAPVAININDAVTDQFEGALR